MRPGIANAHLGRTNSKYIYMYRHYTYTEHAESYGAFTPQENPRQVVDNYCFDTAVFPR